MVCDELLEQTYGAIEHSGPGFLIIVNRTIHAKLYVRTQVQISKIDSLIDEVNGFDDWRFTSKPASKGPAFFRLQTPEMNIKAKGYIPGPVEGIVDLKIYKSDKEYFALIIVAIAQEVMQ